MNYTVQYDWLFSLLNVNKMNESVSEAEFKSYLIRTRHIALIKRQIVASELWNESSRLQVKTRFKSLAAFIYVFNFCI